MRNKSGQISIMIVCLILGIMLAVQFKNTQNSDLHLRGARSDELLFTLNNVTQERDSLAREVISLREKIASVQNNNDATAGIQDELKKANMAAGLLAVEGPGVVVTLNDSTRTVQVDEDPNSYIIHDKDILRVVNELKAAGAEAISVNNERIIAMSEIRCAGTTILVNSNKIGPPFIIRAIGDPQILESGLAIKGGIVEELKYYSLQVQIQKNDRVEIPAYGSAVKFNFSKPKKQ
ncbi:Protein of unknown function DUF881 [Syntrophomonas zehnderi OL-4]|uniref:DUF881 domain-containing protein n=1 Tax=Syntrophomonas zehnderi OL-4 TaxID=690567 RepID=A0A0E4GBV3_9FIRM|nr:DUF881 domain-containing protein [Syntrophomonas zehnderi]CFX63253.1 Protein of unknown function DUF881 [Syntrophomonas zehnderi OL-4]